MKPAAEAHTVEVIRSTEGMKDLLPAWRELFELCQKELPVYAHPAFVRAWLRVDDGVLWRVVVVRDQAGMVQLILPFVQASSLVWHALGSGSVDYQFVLERGNSEEPWRAVRDFFQYQREADEWAVRHLPSESPWHRHATLWQAPLIRKHKDWWKSGSFGLWKEKYDHPYVTGDRLIAAADKLQSATMRRYRNGFEKQSPLEHIIATTPAQLEKYLPDFFDLHVREWRWRGQASEFVSHISRQFFQELALGLAADGIVRLDALKWKGKLLATHFGFVWQGTFHYYKPAFDPDHRNRSPGTLLLRQMLCSTVEEKLETFDFLAGREAYKDDYGPELRKTYTFRLFRSRTALAKLMIRRLWS